MKDYDIARDDKGCQIFTAEIRWVDEEGKSHYVETGDIDLVLNIIALLRHEITLADLLP